MAIGVLAIVVCMSGCAGGSAARPDPGRSPQENLRRLAMSESRSRRATPVDVPIPPGIEPEVLRPRPASDRRARLDLAAALQTIAGPEDVETPVAATALDPEQRDRALQHYINGRDAALRNRHLVAITELEKAAAIDRGSPQILRQLARSYLAMNNSLKAAGYYEQLLKLVPGDSETLFILGLAATNRRDFESAVRYLARPRLAGGHFDHDPAAGFLADYMLAAALRQLGYDRAWIELSRSVVDPSLALTGTTSYSGRVESLFRQRAGIWRGIGDAHCRLGRYEEALEAYRQSSRLPAADPEALHPRVLYANLCLGREWGAQLEMLAALGDDPAPVSDRDIRLCEYLARSAGSVQLLAQAAVDRHRAHPDDPSLVRAAAVLLEQHESVQLLREYLNRRPDDLEVASQLLRWLADRDQQAAVALTVALAEARPLLGAAYGDALAMVGLSASGLLAELEALPPTPARAIVNMRLLTYVGADGQAWQVCSDAIESWPDRQALSLGRIELAARLGEPQLLDAAIAEVSQDPDRATWLARSRARRMLEQTDLAVPAAAAATRVAPDDAEAWVELAEAHAQHAARQTDVGARNQHATDAAVSARRALELDPKRQEAYAVLLGLYAPNGLLNDHEKAAEIRVQLMRSNPQSRLEARLAAQRDIANGRFERALERLLVLCDSDPLDLESLNLMVMVWLQMDRADAALNWLDQRLAARPGDPNLLGQWVAAKGQAGGWAAATGRLEQLIDQEPFNEAAQVLLESLYRRGGETRRAVELAEQRLLRRPKGIRRELELAALYLGADMNEPAVPRLQWILEHAEDGTFEILISAVSVAGRLADHGYDPMVLEYVQLIVDRYPDSPLQVYGMGLRSLAQMDRLDDSFDDLAGRAARHARAATGPTVQAADIWRELAAALVESDQPAAAARALRARLDAGPLDPKARQLLVMVTLATDAAADQPQKSIELVSRLADQGPLPVIPGTQGAPTISELLYHASILYSLVGSGEGAERLLRETIRLTPDHAMALNNLGYTRLELGLGDAETKAWIERAYELAPHDSNVLDTVGWLRYKSGRFQGSPEDPGALALIRESLERAGDDSPEVFDHLGDTLWRLGDTEGAVDAWSEAVKMLEDPSRRDGEIQIYELIQTGRWGLLVADPAEIYDRQSGAMLSQAQDKVREAGAGGTPPIARTFQEAGGTDWAGDIRDGRP